MTPEWYHLHPIAVHFPIALLTLGLAAEAGSILLNQKDWPWLEPSARWILWLGALSAWAAIGSGLLAEETAPHVPAAWEVLEEHETLAFWTAGLFSALSGVRLYARVRWQSLEKKWRLAFLLGWAAAAGVLIATAYHGGQLVYDFGMGVHREI